MGPALPAGDFGVIPLIVGDDLGHVLRPARRDPARARRRDLPQRVRAAAVRATRSSRRSSCSPAIPTVVYGYFALTCVTPLLQDIGPDVGVFNALSAGLVMGVMIIPTVASLSEDAMSAVPRDLRDGAYALGATKLQVSTRVVVPGGGLGHRRRVRARASRARSARR